MVTQAQTPRRLHLRLGATQKTSHFLLKRSTVLVGMLWVILLTLSPDYLEKKEKQHTIKQENVYLAKTRRVVMPRLVFLPPLVRPQNVLICPTDTEDGNEMSRSSSVSTKERAGQGKKAKPLKQRREESDNFDVRSQYTPFFPQQAPTGPTWAPAPQYAPIVPQQFNGVVQNGYQTIPQQFGPQSQSFNTTLMNNGNIQPYTHIPPVSRVA